jgi:cyclic pyranopterin phosphate synthase
LQKESVDWTRLNVAAYYEFARQRGATRLVITGGGEPLLRAEDVVHLTRLGREYFDEIACFTNGTYLTRDLAAKLLDAGLSYLCYSRHHHDDQRCENLMGEGTPTLDNFFHAAGSLKVRATCVMARGYIDTRDRVMQYIDRLSDYGVDEFTFKHTYVAYERSVFGSSQENRWAREHQIEFDPFAGEGQVLGRLPWGPEIKQIGASKVAYYYEPTPNWEKEQLLCRSVNLLSNKMVYASLEDASSRLFRLDDY